MTRTRWGLLLLSTVFTLVSERGWADFSVAPRYEYITGNKEELANRLLVKAKLNSTAGYFGFYVDGFAEFEANKTEGEIRRSPHRGYLQEAFVEFKRNSIYIRMGRQALRWSEMWVVPSLDIWSGRRWNRLYLDPLSEQLTHPTGVSFSYALQNFSVDLVGISELAQSTYPEPLPETLGKAYPQEASGGARVQFDVRGFHFSAIAAQQQKKLLGGLGVNYAFDSVVPKLEVGSSEDASGEALYGRAEEYFGGFGLDLFLGNWIFTPQVTVYDFGEAKSPNGDAQTVSYISGQRKVEPHDLQFMGFVNTTNHDHFWSLSYSYNLTQYFSLGGFVQEYFGEPNSLHWLYRQITGEGLVAGVRLEFIGDWAF